MVLSDFSAELQDLASFALDYGVKSLKDSGGPLVPVVIYLQHKERILHRYMLDLPHIRTQITEQAHISTLYAFAYDGSVTVEGKTTPAIIVEAAELGFESGLALAQKYSFERNLFNPIGTTSFLGPCKSHFSI